MRAREWLDFAQACLIDHFKGHAVCLPPGVELVERRQLLSGGRDDDLAGLAHGDAALGAEGLEHLVAAACELGLERVGRVVEARVHHPGVAPRRVLRETLLLVEHEHAAPRMSPQPRVGEREADDSSPDDGDVVPAHASTLDGT